MQIDHEQLEGYRKLVSAWVYLCSQFRADEAHEINEIEAEHFCSMPVEIINSTYIEFNGKWIK